MGLPGPAKIPHSAGVSGGSSEVVGGWWLGWWLGSVEYRIRDFAIKYGHKLRLDRAKEVKALEDILSQAAEWGTP